MKTYHRLSTGAGKGDLVQPVKLSLKGYNTLDYMLYEGKNCYVDDHSSAQLTWLRDSVDLHMQNCPEYSSLANAYAFSSESLESPADLSRIPILSSSIFKKRQVRSAVNGPIRRCLSSGTQGTHSVVYRDRVTIERLVGGIAHGISEFFPDRENRRAFVLGPTHKESQDLWFSYANGLVELIYDTEFYVRGGVAQFHELASALDQLESTCEPIVIGPPGLVMDFLDWADDSNWKRSADLGLLITAGGWKSRSSESVSRKELMLRVASILGIVEENQRDLFNMVELNTVIFECEAHRKHVPPWLHVSARSASDMSIRAPGELGLLCYLDPSATSFPCMLMSDDWGAIDNTVCSCGRPGPTITLAGRVSTVEERGCGKKMNRYGRG